MACSNAKKVKQPTAEATTTTAQKEVVAKASEKGETAVEEQQVQKVDSLFASIHRTPCYGKCPSYKVQIFESGYAVYDGMMFVEKRGRFEAWFDKEKMQLLIDKAKELGYFEMKAKYDDNVTDLPSCTTTLNAGGKRKTVYNRYGGPESLREFEKIFDQLIESVDWKLVNGPDQEFEEDED